MKANRRRASTHTNGSRTFHNTCDMMEVYQCEIELQSQDNTDTGTPIDENGAHYKEGGVRNKSYIYGVGSSAPLYFGCGRSSLSTDQDMSSISVRAEIDDLREMLRVEQERIRREEESLRREDEMQQMRQ